ncbi:hypothetical protein AMJ80_04000 [bacterium SM23_31]|nr:MAG: hypothetical protein AMJ80_04000 [bacterium SM23_31]
MGSVKDLIILKSAFENKQGLGDFDFSDRYSVFDWGEMPDHIVNKGRALAVMAAFNFEKLERRGIYTHFVGLVKNGKVVKFSDLEEGGNGSHIMRVNMAVKYEPIERKFVDDKGNVITEYDYSFFVNNRGKINNYLLPLEIIFRNGLPLGSSVLDKIKETKEIKDSHEREKSLQGIYTQLGITSEPQPGQMLPKPVMSYTTKLEAGDRILSEGDAYFISGLTKEKFEEVPLLAMKVNEIITEQCDKTGLRPHWDGKVEMVYFNGQIYIVDVVGTLDEDRMGNLVSKELLRQWYKKFQPEFAPACKEWKKTGDGWQGKCPVKPVNLPSEFATLVSQMYMAAANQYVERRIFDTPPLEEVMAKLEKFK